MCYNLHMLLVPWNSHIRSNIFYYFVLFMLVHRIKKMNSRQNLLQTLLHYYKQHCHTIIHVIATHGLTICGTHAIHFAALCSLSGALPSCVRMLMLRMLVVPPATSDRLSANNEDKRWKHLNSVWNYRTWSLDNLRVWHISSDPTTPPTTMTRFIASVREHTECMRQAYAFVSIYEMDVDIMYVVCV